LLRAAPGRPWPNAGIVPASTRRASAVGPPGKAGTVGVEGRREVGDRSRPVLARGLGKPPRSSQLLVPIGGQQEPTGSRAWGPGLVVDR